MNTRIPPIPRRFPTRPEPAAAIRLHFPRMTGFAAVPGTRAANDRTCRNEAPRELRGRYARTPPFPRRFRIC